MAGDQSKRARLTFQEGHDKPKEAVSATSVKLLQAACEIAGGERALARHLGISQTLLSLYLTDVRALPDPLLLRAVDVILEDRQARFAVGAGSSSFRPITP